MTALDEALLDDAGALADADSADTLRSLAAAGAQIRQASTLTAEAMPPGWRDLERPRAVVVAGRGSSTLVADTLAAVIGPAGPVPVVAVTGGALPAWVGALDLVLAISLSGHAEGAVSIAAEAGRRGATLLTVGTESSPLADASVRHRGLHIALPSGRGGPVAVPLASTRTAMWSMLTPALLVAADLGLVPAGPDCGVAGLMAVADVLDAEAEACRPNSEAFVNPAKSLALELHDTVPVVLGNGVMGWVAARRAASALARGARIPAAFGGLPDDAGDIVATFGGPLVRSTEDIFADPVLDGPVPAKLRLLSLELEDELTAHVVAEIARNSGVAVSTVVAEGDTPLRRFAQVVSRVDFAATYLALATGIDPSVSPQLADLREGLR